MKSASDVGSSLAVATFGTTTPTVAEKGREVLAESLGRAEDLLEEGPAGGRLFRRVRGSVRIADPAVSHAVQGLRTAYGASAKAGHFIDRCAQK